MYFVENNISPNQCSNQTINNIRTIYSNNYIRRNIQNGKILFTVKLKNYPNNKASKGRQFNDFYNFKRNHNFSINDVLALLTILNIKVEE